MKVFRITLVFEDALDTRFFFGDESSAQIFFRWLCDVFGVKDEYGVHLQSEVDSEKEPKVSPKEQVRRHMIWNLWNERDIPPEARVYH